MKNESKRVAILVLGDVGRSPRMQYHALSVADAQYTDSSKQVTTSYHVDLIGYKGSLCRPEIINHPNITLHLMNNTPLKNLPSFVQRNFLLRALFKLFIQWFQLLSMLFFTIQKPDYLLVQTPPAVPALIFARMVSIFRRCKLIIDWHNFGYSILALSTKNGIAIGTYKFLEFFFGRSAHYNLCVTEAMKDVLAQKYSIEARVLHDKPPRFFKRTKIEEKHQLLLKLKPSFESWGLIFNEVNGKELKNKDIELTPFTAKHVGSNEIVERRNPSKSKWVQDHNIEENNVLIVSSTSWTPDEDFDVLLDALIEYNKKTVQAEKNGIPKSALAKIILVVTGKGENKEHYEKQMRAQNLPYVKMLTLWLESEDYPTFLGSCDFGVCLHSSSSGLDLPMKVVDMFGSEMPVCAIRFQCLHELVKHDENGLVFETREELADQIFSLFNGKGNKLETMKRNIQQNFLQDRWEQNWNRVVLPLLH